MAGDGSSNPQIEKSRKKRRKAGEPPAVTREKNDAFVTKVRGKDEQGVAELIQMTTTPGDTDRNTCTVLFHMTHVKSSKARGGYHRGGDTEEEYSYEIITSDHRALRKAVIALTAEYEHKKSGSVRLFDKHSINKDKFTVTYRIDEDDDDTNDPNYLSDKVKANQQIQIYERKKRSNEHGPVKMCMPRCRKESVQLL